MLLQTIGHWSHIFDQNYSTAIATNGASGNISLRASLIAPNGSLALANIALPKLVIEKTDAGYWVRETRKADISSREKL